MKAQALIDRYNEIAEKAGFVIASFGLEIQERDKRIVELEAELLKARELVSNNLYDGSERIAELEAQNKELRDACKAFTGSLWPQNETTEALAKLLEESE